jgi:hypothetical protein
MRLSHDPLKISVRFDDPNLVSRAGLIPVMSLAERAGLGDQVRRYVQITAKTGVYPEVKVACLVAGMAAGADSIDDMDLLAVAEHAGDVAEGAAVGGLHPGELGPVGFGVVEQPHGDRVAGGFRDGGHGPHCAARAWCCPL